MLVATEQKSNSKLSRRSLVAKSAGAIALAENGDGKPDNLFR